MNATEFPILNEILSNLWIYNVKHIFIPQYPSFFFLNNFSQLVLVLASVIVIPSSKFCLSASPRHSLFFMCPRCSYTDPAHRHSFVRVQETLRSSMIFFAIKSVWICSFLKGWLHWKQKLPISLFWMHFKQNVCLET